MQKEKNIAELTKDEMAQYTLEPNILLGEFKFDTPIQRYLKEKKYIFYPVEENSKEGFYAFESPLLDVFVDSKELITSVSCDFICCLGKRNLVGMSINDMLPFLKTKPNLIEKLWIDVRGKNQRQTVFDFNNLGIQVWAYREKVVSIMCSNLIEIPNESNPLL